MGQIADNAQHLADEFGVEGRRHFVEQHDLRLERQRAGDGDALLLGSAASTCTPRQQRRRRGRLPRDPPAVTYCYVPALASARKATRQRPLETLLQVRYRSPNAISARLSGRAETLFPERDTGVLSVVERAERLVHHF